MFPPMTSRSRLALFAVAALAAAPAALAQDGIGVDDRRPGSSALVAAADRPDPLVATMARAHSVYAALRGVPLAPLTLAAVVGIASMTGLRRHDEVRGLPVRFGDVGDAWRALLLGAPPALL